MWFNATTYEERDRITALFQTGHRFDGHQPAFVWIEATNFKEKEPVRIAAPCNHAQTLHRLLVYRVHVTCRNTIGDDQRVDTQAPHPMLHVFTHRTERGDKAETAPVHTMQRHQAIEIP